MNCPGPTFESVFSYWQHDEREEGLRFPVPSSRDVPLWDGQTIPILATFPPLSESIPVPPDLRIISADGVLFFVHQTVLVIASDNSFNAQLSLLMLEAGHSDLPLFVLPERSAVLSIILHTLCGRPAQNYSLAIEDIIEAIASLARYGVSPKVCMEREQPLWSLLRYYAPVRPINIYAAAAQYGVDDVAVFTSRYMLDISIPDLAEAHIVKMGSPYLRRLAQLHEQRMDVLRQLILTVPEGHDMTSTCSYNDQDAMKHAWGHAITDLACLATPGLSTKIMCVTLESHGVDLKCSSCLVNFRSHIKSRLLAWSAVERAISSS